MIRLSSWAQYISLLSSCHHVKRYEKSLYISRQLTVIGDECDPHVNLTCWPSNCYKRYQHNWRVVFMNSRMIHNERREKNGFHWYFVFLEFVDWLLEKLNNIRVVVKLARKWKEREVRMIRLHCKIVCEWWGLMCDPRPYSHIPTCGLVIFRTHQLAQVPFYQFIFSTA